MSEILWSFPNTSLVFVFVSGEVSSSESETEASSVIEASVVSRDRKKKKQGERIVLNCNMNWWVGNNEC